MTAPLTIALDGMGGDQAPRMVVAGANLARKRFPNANFLLFGDEPTLTPMVKRFSGLAERVTIEHADEVVLDEDKPSVAMRQRRRSSMRLAIDAVGEGRAAAMVSAGNTGALMATSKLVLKTLPGIGRPAIVGVFPTQRGESVVLDLGANVDCSARNLCEFAVMGAVFARAALGVTNPTVGLLNVGAEALKGNDTVRSAAAILAESDLPFTFHGYVEGNDIAAGTVDVFVTDGFTGNIVLKTAEGTARLFVDFLRRALKRSMSSRIGALLARSAYRALREQLDPRRHNGAMFLGLNGIAIKSHGGTDAIGFANAIGVAVDTAVQGCNTRIVEELQRIALVDSASIATRTDTNGVTS